MELPIELHHLIFRKLPLKDIGNVSLVCHYFNNIIMNFDWDNYLS